MIELSIETNIQRPVGEVFAYCTDPARLATWQTNTVSAVQEGDGQMGVGTRLREVHRAPGGKELDSVVEVSEYELDRTFALRVIEGTPIHAHMTFEPTERGTLTRFVAHGELSGAMRLVQPLLQRILKRQFARDCAALKRVLENAPASASSAGPSSTTDRKVAKVFGLEGESWMRHANPASVWTRFTGVSVLSLAIWSRDWIGVWCLIPVALGLVWLLVNPRLFKAPKSTRSWASRAVLGERIWVDRDKVAARAIPLAGSVTGSQHVLGHRDRLSRLRPRRPRHPGHGRRHPDHARGQALVHGPRGVDVRRHEGP